MELQLVDSGGGDKILDSGDLTAAFAVFKKDWSVLSARIRTIEHDITTDNRRLNLRLHYPALRDAQATVAELVRTLTTCLPHFSLSRKQVDAAYAKMARLPSDFERHLVLSDLDQEARSLFMRARSSTVRTGEAGELLLYLLTEWLLDAPQIIAKMTLKTNAQMPVHGSDGIHARFDATTGNLIFYSGEAKLHGTLSSAIKDAVRSIKDGAGREKAQREIELVRRNIDLAGLDPKAQVTLLRYLDPCDEAYNKRIEVVTCLIGFDFADYAKLNSDDGDPDEQFKALALAKLRSIGPAFSKAMAEAGLSGQRVELFLFPVPSVKTFRDLFQDQIGWTKG